MSTIKTSVYLELVEAFGAAIRLAVKQEESHTGYRAHHDLGMEALAAIDAAFEVAKRCGWDWENDEEWAAWSELGSLAGVGVVAAHALAMAIKKCPVLG